MFIFQIIPLLLSGLGVQNVGCIPDSVRFVFGWTATDNVFRKSGLIEFKWKFLNGTSVTTTSHDMRPYGTSIRKAVQIGRFVNLDWASIVHIVECRVLTEHSNFDSILLNNFWINHDKATKGTGKGYRFKIEELLCTNEGKSYNTRIVCLKPTRFCYIWVEFEDVDCDQMHTEMCGTGVPYLYRFQVKPCDGQTTIHDASLGITVRSLKYTYSGFYEVVNSFLGESKIYTGVFGYNEINELFTMRCVARGFASHVPNHDRIVCIHRVEFFRADSLFMYTSIDTRLCSGQEGEEGTAQSFLDRVCVDGYKMIISNKSCQPCDAFHYGRECELKCEACKIGCSNLSPDCIGTPDKKCVVFENSGLYCNVTCNSSKFNPYNEDTCEEYCQCRDLQCRATDGYCTNGCGVSRYSLPGQPYCMLICPPGTYGPPDCLNECNCENFIECYSDGECQDLDCKVNFKGRTCEQFQCETFYGPNCAKKCHCRYNDPCDRETGACKHGCDVRFWNAEDEVDCQRTCNSTQYMIAGNCIAECHCQDNTYCNVINGHCVSVGCAVGWTGLPTCQQRCIYGDTCPNGKSCHCANGNSDCNPTNGACPGACGLRYYGKTCQDVCREGSFNQPNELTMCSGVCHCKTQSTCNATDGGCLQDGCVTGRYGGSCQKVCTAGESQSGNCSFDCHCLDDDDCDIDTGRCSGECALRYKKDPNDVCQKTKCKEGQYLYLDNCIDCHCKIDSFCHVLTGRCYHGGCKTGYVPPDCLNPCKYGKLDQGCSHMCHCMHDIACDPLTGDCPQGDCDVRYFGADCQKQCDIGKFALSSTENECLGTCHCEDNTGCRARDGHCLNGECQDGWLGLNCMTEIRFCRNGCAKTCRCQDTTEECHTITGYCISGCSLRYYGQGCEDTCQVGKFYPTGQTCSKSCRCKTPSKCRVTDGKCMNDTCQVGYAGESCQDTCQYGEHCVKMCNCLNNAACNQLSGRCPSDLCDLRHHGIDCQGKCDIGKFVDKFGKCKGVCHCSDNNLCAAQTGKCHDRKCEPGYFGDDCQQKCLYGDPPHCNDRCNCKNDDVCDNVTGECPNGCDIRHHGVKDCQRTCAPGFFLDNKTQCTKTCRCLNPAKCSVKSGVCVGGICAKGWQGEDCQKPCYPKQFGQNCNKQCHCKSDITNTCNSITGLCSDGCHGRYTGYNCQESCPYGKYFVGGSCTGVCHCKNDTKCHVTTGKCLENTGCATGYKEQNHRCNEKCANKTWGINCKKTCFCLGGIQCNHVTGVCGSGCDYRHTGSTCQDEYLPIWDVWQKLFQNLHVPESREV